MTADFASEYKNTLAMTLKGLWSPEAKIGPEGKLPDNRQFKTWAEELVEDRKMIIDGTDVPIAMLQEQIKDDANASRLLKSQFGTDNLEKIILTEKQVEAADSAFKRAENKTTGLWAMIINFIQGLIDYFTGASPENSLMGAVARKSVDNFTGKADQLLAANVPDLDNGVRQYLVGEAEKKAEQVAELRMNENPRALEDVRIGELRPASSDSKPEASTTAGVKPSTDAPSVPDTSATLTSPVATSAKPMPSSSTPSATASSDAGTPAPKKNSKKPNAAPTVFSPSAAPQKIALQPIVERAVDKILAENDVRPDANDPEKNQAYLDAKKEAARVVTKAVEKNAHLVTTGRFDTLAEAITRDLAEDAAVGKQLVKAARDKYGVLIKFSSDEELLQTDPVKGKGKIVIRLESQIKELFQKNPGLRTDLGGAVTSNDAVKTGQGYAMVDLGEGYRPPVGGFRPPAPQQLNDNTKTVPGRLT